MDTLATDIDTYLRELRGALEGADLAVTQDALYDAEEHLQAELAAITEEHREEPGRIAGDLAAAIERYGSPQEVAEAYRRREEALSATSQPSGTSTKQGPWRKFFGVVVESRTYLALLYMIISLATGIAFFTIVVTGISLGAGFLVLIIGIPFFLGFLAVVRALSLAEGRIVEKLLGTRMPRRARSEPRDKGIGNRIRFWMKDRRTWTAMLYMILLCPLGTIYFSVSVAGLAGGGWLVVLPFFQAATGHSYVDVNDAWYEFPVWSLPLMAIAGALVIVLFLHLVRLMGRLHGGFAKAMLVRLG